MKNVIAIVLISLVFQSISFAQDDAPILPFTEEGAIDCEAYNELAIEDLQSLWIAIATDEYPDLEEVNSEVITQGIYITSLLIMEACYPDNMFMQGSLGTQESNTSEPIDNADIGSSRDNPIPLGESYTFIHGQVRVVSAEIKEDIELLAVYLEYTCERYGDETCTDGQIGIASYITAGGVVETELIVVSSNSDPFDGEVFSGAKIEGNIFFNPVDTEPNLLRLSLQIDDTFKTKDIFFSLAE